MPFERNADYIQVDERIQKFYEKYPDGRLQSELIEYHVEGRGKVGNADVLVGYVLVKATAYRSEADLLPGVGYSSMVMPGGTPYTRNSELENTETSAWGRAIAALGIEVRRGIASAEEVANRENDGQPYQVYITPSLADAPAKGGHQKTASRAQITQIIEMSKEYDLSTLELAGVVHNLVDVPLIGDVNADEETQKRQVKELLVSLTAEQAGTVIQSMLEAGLPDIPDDQDQEPK